MNSDTLHLFIVGSLAGVVAGSHMLAHMIFYVVRCQNEAEVVSTWWWPLLTSFCKMLQ